MTIKNNLEENLPASVYSALGKIQSRLTRYNIKVKPASSAGENSYGQVLQIELSAEGEESRFFVVKLSPKNEARRKQMEVVAYYTREVFMYERVLQEYLKVQDEHHIGSRDAFDSVPKMFFSSLADNDEFLIFEDLHQAGYLRFDRHLPLTFYHTALALKELAKYHAMSFVLKSKKPQLFGELVDKLRCDNLFHASIEPVTIEFGKKYVRKTMEMIEDDTDLTNKESLLQHLRAILERFTEVCAQFVDGRNAEPFSVICHGDFWNNNILYQYDENGSPIAAKLLDFQMSRYASPALDFVHYLFTCTEKVLRDQHFEDLKRCYHASLSDHLKLFCMDPDAIFSYATFEDHLKRFGLFGFCMSVYAVPFFISDSNDIPDLDEISEAVIHMNDMSEADAYSSSSSEGDKNCRTSALLNNFELLNDNTIPIFRRRMIGIVLDLDKYDMFHYDF